MSNYRFPITENVKYSSDSYLYWKPSTELVDACAQPDCLGQDYL